MKIKFGFASALMILVLKSVACVQPPFSPPPGEVEATEFMGKKLTAINEQRTNGLAGTKVIDKNTYILTVDGLVDRPLSLNYAELQSVPQISRLTDLNCVEGWVTAKWMETGTGFHF
jgi:DMSO/TMAO reductase YedYZ molybdopterin-dependent catalytic subunit